jgi:hypothetical protein
LPHKRTLGATSNSDHRVTGATMNDVRTRPSDCKHPSITNDSG